MKKIIGGEADEYGQDFIEMKFNSNDNLPLNKTLKLYNLTLIVSCVFQKDGKYYLQIFLRWMFLWIVNARIW